jgi:hypothetical protein
VTLAVHPRFGEEVAVVSLYGRNAVRAETVDEQLIFLPVAWTTLRPRAEPLAVKGRTVLLAPESLRELAAWVADRAPAAKAHHDRNGQEVGHFDKDTENRRPDGVPSNDPAEDREKRGGVNARGGERCSAGGDSAAAVVGQAGSPSAHREQRERGKR